MNYVANIFCTLSIIKDQRLNAIIGILESVQMAQTKRLLSFN